MREIVHSCSECGVRIGFNHARYVLLKTNLVNPLAAQLKRFSGTSFHFYRLSPEHEDEWQVFPNLHPTVYNQTDKVKPVTVKDNFFEFDKIECMEKYFPKLLALLAIKETVKAKTDDEDPF